VIEDRQVAVLLDQAEVQRRLGNVRGALGLAQRALTIDPDHAAAHATLAVILLDGRRLAAAGIEARAALALDGNDPYIHRVAAAVLTAERKLADAWAHCLIALQAPEPPPEAHVLAARIQVLQGDDARARELLHDALALHAMHTGALTALARLELGAGHHAEAARWIELALRSDPGDRPAHLAAGHIALAAGDATGAERHARFVLEAHADDRDALALWAAIQARRSRVLGAWWRWNLWITLGDDRRRIAILLGSFVLARLAIIVTDELGYPGLAAALQLGWLAMCVYTWVAPGLFRRMLARALATVRLDPEF